MPGAARRHESGDRGGGSSSGGSGGDLSWQRAEHRGGPWGAQAAEWRDGSDSGSGSGDDCAIGSCGAGADRRRFGRYDRSPRRQHIQGSARYGGVWKELAAEGGPGAAASGGGCGAAAGQVARRMVRDCQAIGQIAVQLYLGRTCLGPPQHRDYWLQLAARLPGAARRFVRLCFDPWVTSERLLSDAFFGSGLHAAHRLLRTTMYEHAGRRPPALARLSGGGEVAASAAASGGGVGGPDAPLPHLLQPPELRLPQQLAALAAAAAGGRLDELADAQQRPSLLLCLPHIMQLLWRAAAACASSPAASSATAASTSTSTCSTAPHISPGAATDSATASLGVPAARQPPCTASSALSYAAAQQMSGQVYDILLALLRLLPPDRVLVHILPYVCACLSCFRDDVMLYGGEALPADSLLPPPPPLLRGSGHAKSRGGRCLVLQHRLLSPGLHVALLQGSDLDSYVHCVLPLLLAALLCTDEVSVPTDGRTGRQHPVTAASQGPKVPVTAGGGGSGAEDATADAAPQRAASDGGSGGGMGVVVGGVARALAIASISDAAAAVLVTMAGRLPLPLLLERVVGPMLTSLTVGTAVPRLLVQLCAELGGQLTARHVAPALLQLAVIPAPPPPPPTTTTATARSSARQQSARGARSGALSGVSGGAAAADAAPMVPEPIHPLLQHQIYTSLSVLTAVQDLLPREFIPRVFLRGLPPSAPPPLPAAAGSPQGGLPPSPSLPHSGSFGHISGGGSAAVSDSTPSFSSPRSGADGGGGGGAATAGSGGLPPLRKCLLDPTSFQLAPGTLTMLAGLSLRAFARLARPENLAWVVLPHVEELLKHAAPKRRLEYRANGTVRRRDASPVQDQGPQLHRLDVGAAAVAAAGANSSSSSVGGGGGSGGRELHRSRSSPCAAREGATGGGSAGGGGGGDTAGQGGGGGGGEAADEEDGYWELVHCVYGQLVDSCGLLTVRSVLPGWQAVEAGLAARMGWSPAAQGAWNAAAAMTAAPAASGGGGDGSSSSARDDTGGSGGSGLDSHSADSNAGNGGGGGNRRSQSSLDRQIRQEIASKQQHVAALQGTHLFIKEVGWSAPSSLLQAVRTAPKDVPAAGAGAGGGGGGRTGLGTLSASGAAGGGGGGGMGALGYKLLGVVGGGGGGLAGPADEYGAEGEGFVWPQLLAIGSPTVVEGLAMRTGGGGSNGGGGGGGALSRQPSGVSTGGGGGGGGGTSAVQAVSGSARRGVAGSGSGGGGGGGGSGGGSRSEDSAGSQTSPTPAAAERRSAGSAGRKGVVEADPGPPTLKDMPSTAVAADSGRQDSVPMPDAWRPRRENPEQPSTLLPGSGTTTPPSGAPDGSVSTSPSGLPTSPDAAASAFARDSASAAKAAVSPPSLELTAPAPPPASDGTASRSPAGKTRGSPLHPELRLTAAKSEPPSTSKAGGAPRTGATAAEGSPAGAAAVGAGSDLALVSSSPFPTAAAPTPAAAPPPATPPPSPVEGPADAAQPSMTTTIASAEPQGGGGGGGGGAAAGTSTGAGISGDGGSRRYAGAGGSPALAPLLIPPPVLADGTAPDTGGHRWSWLPPLPVDVAAATAPLLPQQPSSLYSSASQFGGGGGGGGSGHSSSYARAARARLLSAGAPPPASDVWSLQATVVHSWPAHKDRIRALAVHPNECAVLTAGRGAVAGREGPVVRVWSLSDCLARVQYAGHRVAVQSLLLLRAARSGGAVVVSMDVAGQVHVWSYDSGQQLATFLPAAASGSGGGGGGGAGGAGGGGGGGGGGGASAASVSGSGEVHHAADGEASGGSWADLIDRSGHYLLNQPAEAVGWQGMGGLKTSRQLSATSAGGFAAAAATRLTSNFSPRPGSAAVAVAGSGRAGGAAVGLGLGMGLGLTSAVGTGAVGAGFGAGAAAVTVQSMGVGVGGGGAGAGGGAPRQGYSVMCAAADEHRLVYAGTVDARLCVLDLERSRIVAEWLAAPAVRQDAEDAVTALCSPAAGGGMYGGPGDAGGLGGWSAAAPPWLAPEVVGVGSRGGRVTVLDRRCGTAALAFRAHGGEVSCMASYGSHTLVTAGSDKLLRLWDLRRCGGSGSGSSHGPASSPGTSAPTPPGYCSVGAGYDSRTGPWAGWEGPRAGGAGCAGEPLWGVCDALSPAGVGAAVLGLDGFYGSVYGSGGEMLLPPLSVLVGGAMAAPAMLRSFSLPREGVQSLRVLRDCVLMTSGSSVGVLALAGEALNYPSPSASPAASAAPGPGAAPSFARLRNGRGGRESAAITGLALLPCCRLMAVSGEDGAVRICR